MKEMGGKRVTSSLLEIYTRKGSIRLEFDFFGLIILLEFKKTLDLRVETNMKSVGILYACGILSRFLPPFLEKFSKFKYIIHLNLKFKK